MESLQGRLIIVGLAFALAACASNTAPAPRAEAVPPTFADEYRIGIGDALSIHVYRNPDLSVNVPVRPDGKITVPVAGDVSVGGLTPEEVSATVATALSDYIRDPIVTTTVTGMNSNDYLTRVRVTGAVNGPKSIPYRNGMTVMDVVLDAGGISEYANASKTVIYRASGDKVKVRLDKILNAGDLSTNYSLLPGDVITIPEKLF